MCEDKKKRRGQYFGAREETQSWSWGKRGEEVSKGKTSPGGPYPTLQGAGLTLASVSCTIRQAHLCQWCRQRRLRGFEKVEAAKKMCHFKMSHQRSTGVPHRTP